MSPPAQAPRRAGHAVAIAAALLLFATVVAPLWRPLLLACVLAAALAGWQDRLARATGRRPLAAGLLTAGVVVLVVAPLAALGTVLVSEAIDAAQSLFATFQQRGLSGTLALLPSALEGPARQLAARLPGSWDAVVRNAAAQATAAAGVVSGALSRTSSLLFDAAMMLVALFFLLVDGRRLVGWLCRTSPLGEETTARVLTDLRRTGTSVLTSLLATAAIQAAVATLGYWIAGVSQPLVFGLLTFFAAFLPSVGTSLVALPIAAALLLGGHLVAGIFLAAWGLLVTGTIDNVLKPWLARGGVRIHGGVVFFAMIGGILAYGALGLLVGPLAVSLLLALVHVGRREARRPPGRRDDGARAAREGAPALGEGAPAQDA